MKFTKFIVLLMALTLIVGLVACNDGDKDTSSQTTSSKPSTSSGAESSNPASGEESNTSNPASGEESDTSDPASGEESAPANSLFDGDLEDILAAIYEGAKDVEDLKYIDPENLTTTEIEPDDCFYYFGVQTLDFKEAIASEFDMGGAYSLCLVRAKSANDVENLKKTISENVNPWKWVCMGVDEDKVVVDSVDDVIILIMYEHSDLLHDIFLDLADNG